MFLLVLERGGYFGGSYLISLQVFINIYYVISFYYVLDNKGKQEEKDGFSLFGVYYTVDFQRV